MPLYKEESCDQWVNLWKFLVEFCVREGRKVLWNKDFSDTVFDKWWIFGEVRFSLKNKGKLRICGERWNFVIFVGEFLEMGGIFWVGVWKDRIVSSG